MAKGCYVKEVKAKNGNDSILFKELSKMLGDDQKALRAYLTTFTDKFKKAYGDWESGEVPASELDENGEVTFDEFSKSHVSGLDLNLDDVDHPAAEMLDREYNSIVKMRDKMIDVLTKKVSILRLKTGGGTPKEMKARIKAQITNLEDTKNKIEELGTLQGMIMFSKNAIFEINNSYDKLQGMIKDKDVSPSTLAQFKNYISAYDIIDDIEVSLRSQVDKKGKWKNILNQLAEAKGQKDSIKKIYMDHMKDFVAEKFAAVSYKRSERELRLMLDNADGDVSWAEYLMDYMGDSKDPTLSLTAKIVDEQNQTTRKEHIEIQKELVDAVKKLEGADKTNTPSKLYDFMLEKNGDEYTGNVVASLKTGTEAQKEFYAWYMKTMDKYDRFLPQSKKLNRSLPFIRRDDLERTLEKSGGVVNAVKESLKSKFVRQGDDTDKGMIIDESNEIVDFVPIHYVNKIDSNVYQEELQKLTDSGMEVEDAQKKARVIARKALNADRSYDVGAALNAFTYSAINYKNMSEVVDLLEGVRDIVKERTFNQKDSGGNQIIDYAKGLIDKKRKESGKVSNAAKQIDAFMKMLVYGQNREDAGYWEIMGIKADKAKVVSAVNSYSSFSLLGLNFMAGFQNTLQGGTMQWAEAHAGQFMSKKGLLDASFEYYKNFTGIVGDIGARLPTNKINLLNQRLDTLGDYKDRVADASKNTRFKKLVTSNTLFFMTQGGEHLLQSKVMIAMLKNLPALDKDGNKVEGIESMYEAYSAKDGKLVLDERVAWTDKDENRFTRQLQALLRRMHGNYPNHTAAAFQKDIWLATIGMFRKWVRPGYLRRYETTRDNEFLEATTEGSYRSFGRFIKNYKKDIFQFKVDLVREDFNGLSSLEKENIKRVIVEIGTLTVGMIAAAVFTSLADDDEDNKAYLFLAYQANRLSSELRFFINPVDMISILRTPAASLSVVESVVRLTTQMMPYNIGEEYVKGPRDGELKVWKKVEDVAPVYKQFRKAFTEEGLEAQLQWFNLN